MKVKLIINIISLTMSSHLFFWLELISITSSGWFEFLMNKYNNVTIRRFKQSDALRK